MSPAAAWVLARFELVTLLKRRETLLWIFLMPVIFFYFIGTITSGMSGGGGAFTGTPLLVDLPDSAGFLGNQVMRRLEHVGFIPVLKDTVADPEIYTRRLQLPPDLTAAVVAGETAAVGYSTKREGLTDDFDTFRLNRALITVMADMAVVDSPLTAEHLAALAARPPSLTVESTRAGFLKDIPQGFNQAVPGTMVMFTLLIMLTSGAVLLVIEREQGLLRRLASAPLSRTTVVMGKWGSRIGLGAIQLAFAMLLGSVLFQIDWGPHLPMLVLVLAVYASLCGALGVLLGSLARNEKQAVFLGVLSSNVLAALGGCWWPIEVVPRWMQRLALFLPTGQAMDAMHQLVNYGAPVQAVFPHLAILGAMTVGAWILAARLFRYA